MVEENILDDAGLDLIFRNARTHKAWQNAEVSEVKLQAIYDLMKMGPTSANCSPLRIQFVQSQESKERLKPALMEGNVDKTMAAPVTAILINDMEFYENLPRLFPHADARSWFVGKQKFIEETAMRNGSLQGAYFIIAARALGLDCGPMSGFNKTKVKETFFPDKPWEANFLCNLGYGDDSALYEREPRLAFDEACEII
jgi:3-hydroxypropanoate dehydrogenase